MRAQHRSFAILVALLLTAAPASATLIAASAFRIASEAVDLGCSASIEFDVDDWVAFIRSGPDEYPLSGLGSGIEAFGGPDEIRALRPKDLDDEDILTQVWERP